MKLRRKVFTAIALITICVLVACQGANNPGNSPTATSTVAPTPKPSPPQAAVNAVKALRKMAGATEIGINFQEYSSRLIDLKAEVDEALMQLPEGELKNEISLAMEAYVDAKQGWNEMITDDYLLVQFEPGRSLQKKYSIPGDGDKRYPAIRKKTTLSIIWGAADKHINRASQLLNQ